ncbi:MAG TPA: transcription elongation factor Spt5 [Nitrososphaera sp.]|nr:transcription elongation factor Spt5 [Nitrososphaera sp.]
MSDRNNGAQEEANGHDDITSDDDKPSQGSEAEQPVESQQSTETREEPDSSQLDSNIEAKPANASQSDRPQIVQQETASSDSKFFAIRTTGGQERVVASLLQTRVNAKKLGIRSIMVLESFKGYIVVEAPDSNVAYEALSGIRHVRGQIRGDLPFKDIEGYLVKKPVVSELSIDDTVEVIAGPFKSMKAKITRVDYEKQEATVVLLDSPYQIPVTVDANYLKKVLH